MILIADCEIPLLSRDLLTADMPSAAVSCAVGGMESGGSSMGMQVMIWSAIGNHVCAGQSGKIIIPCAFSCFILLMQLPMTLNGGNA